VAAGPSNEISGDVDI
jgi:hypothetical protein